MTTILVIDDELDLCETIKIFFTCRGYKMIYALTGTGGLDAFEAERPSIVILELFLKDMCGMDIIKRIRSKDPSCKIIVITSSTSEKVRRQALKLGVSYYLSKPFSIKVLNSMILRLGWYI